MVTRQTPPPGLSGQRRISRELDVGAEGSEEHLPSERESFPRVHADRVHFPSELSQVTTVEQRKKHTFLIPQCLQVRSTPSPSPGEPTPKLIPVTS